MKEAVGDYLLALRTLLARIPLIAHPVFIRETTPTAIDVGSYRTRLGDHGPIACPISDLSAGEKDMQSK